MKTPAESPDSLEISIHYDHARDTAYGGVLSMNLKDLVRCFGLKGFRRHHPKAVCDGVFAPGRVKLKIADVPPAEVFTLLEAFRKSMAKSGFKLLFSYGNPSQTPRNSASESRRNSGGFNLQAQITALAVDNPRLRFTMPAASVGPLLKPCGGASTAFHWAGDSSLGKTGILPADSGFTPVCLGG